MSDLKITDQDALDFHTLNGKPGKVSLKPTKPLCTQSDLAKAYSPGVAAPCLAIHKDPADIYKYTAKGNLVAVITDGSAVLGLGPIGAAASKPVMEGKAVLFKTFADVDAVDIEVDVNDPEKFINAVRYLAPSWGGINLEDIKAPNCFIIEEKLREVMDIPVFHDDQHGTAIVCAAGLINALDMTNRKFSDVKIVLNGPGAAGLACIKLLKSMGVPHNNVIICDREGVVRKDRTTPIDPYKAAHVIDTEARTLADALKGADVFLGLSAKDVLSADMLKSMSANPIIFAMANPDPEIDPKIAKEIRPDAIIATGRSDYPNQINNVSGFPYIFRGALDVRATAINEKMKIAAAHAISHIARQPVPDEVRTAYGDKNMDYGPEYIMPTPFDPRLIIEVSAAVAQAAMDSGVAKQPIDDIDEYKRSLLTRFHPINNILGRLYNNIKNHPKNIIFAEGEEVKSINSAYQWYKNGYGIPILIGRENLILEKMNKMSIDPEGIKIENASLSETRNEEFIELMYKKLQREGHLLRDCIHSVKTDRNIFASCMLIKGYGDILVTGLTRSFTHSLDKISQLVDTPKENTLFGFLIALIGDNVLFIADTAINENPTSLQLANISCQMSKIVKNMGYNPKVAFVSHANFGNPKTNTYDTVKETMNILRSKDVSFQFDGEMSVAAALKPELRELYKFCQLDGKANILIMPDLHSANISTQLLDYSSDCKIIGPIMVGFEKSVQILNMDSSVTDILHAAVCAVEVNS